MVCDKSSAYYASRMAQNESKSFAIPFSNDWFYEEFKEFYGILCGDGQSIGYEDFISPVFIMNAIERSLKGGEEETVRSVKI